MYVVRKDINEAQKKANCGEEVSGRGKEEAE
jgi:hypothetical protein